jgi:hypothetical protein
MALRVRISRGEDPAGEKSALRDQATFRELALDYLERYAKPHRRSWREDQRRLDASILPRIGKTTAALVSPADIIRLHDEVTARGAAVEALDMLLNGDIQSLDAYLAGNRKLPAVVAEVQQIRAERARPSPLIAVVSSLQS